MRRRASLLAPLSMLHATGMCPESLCSRLLCLHLLFSFPSLFDGTASAITCYCSQCIESNYTCTTSGKCLFYASRENEVSSWKSRYECVEPARESTLCNSPTPETSTFRLVCCAKDMCNKAVVIAQPTERGVSILGDEGKSLSKDTGTNVVIYIVAGVAVFVMVVLTAVILVTYWKYHRAHHRALQQQLGQGARTRSTLRREQDGRLHCQCCHQRDWGRGSPINISMCEQGRGRHGELALSSSRTHQNDHNHNSQQPHTHYSVQADIGRPPFAVQVDPISQSPVPSTRHHLQLALHKPTDHSSSTGSDSTGSWSGMSTECSRPLTGSDTR